MRGRPRPSLGPSRSRLGPLFAVSFVAGVIRALRRLRPELRPDPHPSGALGGHLDRPRPRRFLEGPRSSSSRPARAITARPRSWRGPEASRSSAARSCATGPSRRSPPTSSGNGWPSASPPAGWSAWPAGSTPTTSAPAPSVDESHLPPRPRVDLHGPAAPPEEPRRPPRRLARGRPPDRGLADPGRPRARARPARRIGPRRSGWPIASISSGGVDDPADLLRAADAFVLPSVAEGMSNSLLEAMATSLPCLASAIGGNTDLLHARARRAARPAERPLGLVECPPPGPRRPRVRPKPGRGRPAAGRGGIRPDRRRRPLPGPLSPHAGRDLARPGQPPGTRRSGDLLAPIRGGFLSPSPAGRGCPEGG